VRKRFGSVRRGSPAIVDPLEIPGRKPSIRAEVRGHGGLDGLRKLDALVEIAGMHLPAMIGQVEFERM